MKYILCLWLCFVCLVCDALYGVYGLHVEQAPEIIQRITRQATRYGSGGGGGSISGPNYRPSSGANYNVRNIASDLTAGLSSSQQNSVSGNPAQRPAAVGAYTFGGMASGRPTNGNSFVVNNSLKNSGQRTAQPSPGQTIVGSGSVVGGSGAGGRPQQLQHALMQAAQYQLQQHQQLRRQMPQQQQLYRHRPANNYQQYN